MSDAIKLTRFKHKSSRQELTPDQLLAIEIRKTHGRKRPTQSPATDKSKQAEREVAVGYAVGTILRIVFVLPFLIPWVILKYTFKVIGFFMEHSAAIMYLSIWAVLAYFLSLIGFLFVIS